ncbi:hypothetical protein [Spongiactinospora sp. 9N601]|uniref:hypothetical protein n=1 Tax=Spongiactinospora sp. 9N601 TaxID=3375149 RepID=UPI0037B7E0AD
MTLADRVADLAAAAERSAWWRETVWAVRDGAHWAWLVASLTAAAVWLARGMPSPVTAAAAAAAALTGSAAAAWRARRRVPETRPAGEARRAAGAAWRAALAAYATAAAVVWAVAAGAVLPVLLAAAVVVHLAVLTIPVRARRRLLARLRIGAAAVAGRGQDDGDAVRVGRARWSGSTGRTLDQVHITYPASWAAHAATRRDELVERMMWELCGPPPSGPAAAAARPDYLTSWDHVRTRLEIARVPSLPRMLPARDWERPAGAIVLGQTTPDLADLVATDGTPLATYDPAAHALIVGATQHGKSSGVRDWAVDGLVHGVWPGGLWAVDGKGSGSLAALTGRRGVHDVAHSPEEWRAVITGAVAPEVARRYAQMLAWRSGQASARPAHPRALLILDEIQQVLLACPDLAPVLGTLARQALEAGVILWVITQRPDARDAVPGALRDQLVDRVSFGPLGGAGAKMAFDIAGDWHRALGVAPIAGRALTWMGGTWRTVQAPWLPIPADVPAAERLYPPRHPPRRRPSPRPGPAPPPDDPPSDPRQGGPGDDGKRGPHGGAERPPEARQDPAGPTPAGEAAEGENGPQGPPPIYDPADPYAARRRRRRQ